MYRYFICGTYISIDNTFRLIDLKILYILTSHHVDLNNDCDYMNLFIRLIESPYVDISTL